MFLPDRVTLHLRSLSVGPTNNTQSNADSFHPLTTQHRSQQTPLPPSDDKAPASSESTFEGLDDYITNHRKRTPGKWFCQSRHMVSMEGPVAPEDEAPTTGSSEKAYALPSWFLEHNVKTSWDLATIPDQMVFCKCKDCEEAKLADNAFESVKQSGGKPDGVSETNEPAQAPDEVQYKTFSELRDVTCASFMHLQNGSLDQNSTIVFRMQEKDASLLEPAWMSRVVVQAAKASKGISMISFDLETLEELGSEFHQQDKERNSGENSVIADRQPDMSSLTTFLRHFFAITSEANAHQKDWQRNQQALSAVLYAVKVKETARCLKVGERDGSDAVLIHIMDCSLVDKAIRPWNIEKERILPHIAETVRARRRQGERVAIFLSTKCRRYKPDMEGFNEIGGTKGSTVTASRDKILDWDQRKEVRRGIINTQRMRRLMRHRLPSDLFCAELLTFDSDWASENWVQSYMSFGKKL